jgi:formate dehydrogenase subunit gamma
VPTTWPAAITEDIRDSISHFANVEGSVLRALQNIQDTFGYVPDAALNTVAEICNVSRAEVYGVFTYYSDFRSTPPAPNIIKVCVAEACQANGSDSLVATLSAELGLDVHAKSRTEDVEVAPVFCLGNCALGPAALVNNQLLGRATVEKIREAIAGGV